MKNKRVLYLVILFCPLIFLLFFHYKMDIVYADNNQEIIDEMSQSANHQLEGLDFDSLDEILEGFSKSQIQIFGGTSFLSKLKDMIAGNFDSGEGVWKAIVSCLFASILDIMPIMSLIVAISLIGSMVQGIRPSNSGKSMSNIIHFVTYGVIVVLVLSLVARFIAVTTSTIQVLKVQMDKIFPLLLTLLTAIGGTVSVSVYQPAMIMLSGVIINIFTNLLLPIFIFSVVFSVLSNLSSNVKLEKITSFFQSVYKWIIGLVFTIFTAFISVQGITAGSVDGISIRTAKYAIKSYVPILGSYLSDGMGVVIASSNLIKNTVGAAGLMLILATIILPIVEMVLFMLALKLVAGIIEPLGNKQIANFISSLSKSLVLLIALILGIAFVYFIVIGLVMCSANIVWLEGVKSDRGCFILGFINCRRDMYFSANRTYYAWRTDE